jgi:hypothetical protein
MSEQTPSFADALADLRIYPTVNKNWIRIPGRYVVGIWSRGSFRPSPRPRCHQGALHHGTLIGYVELVEGLVAVAVVRRGIPTRTVVVFHAAIPFRV